MESVQVRPLTQMKRIKRGTLIIKKGLQSKFILLVMISILLAVCLIMGDIYYLFGRDVVSDLMDPGLYELFLNNNKVLLAKLVIYLVVVGVVTVFLSHKLAGPIYRFEQSAKVVGGGDLTYRVHLRKGDELMDLQDEFNRMLESLQGRVVKDRHLAEKISRALNELVQGKSVSPELVSRLKEIKTEVDSITNSFKA